jgi:hypothetical protein
MTSIREDDRRVAVTRFISVLSLVGLLSAVPAHAQSVEEFYKGKRLEIRVGTASGGGYDLAARLVARTIGKYLPGHPSAIVQNVPGAGGVTLMNQLFATAPRDGSVIGIVTNGMPTAPLLTPNVAHFDITRFRWLGSPGAETQVVMVWHTAKVQTLKDLFKTELVVGAIAPGTATYDVPVVANAILGTKFKVVSGYKNTAAIELAMQRGELQGNAALGWISLKTRHQDWLREGKAKVIVQYGLKKHPDLPHVPLFGLPADASARQAIKVMFARQEFGRPFLAPPGVPPDRLEALRQALMATMKDTAFLADANKAALDINPIPGRELDALSAEIAATPPQVANRLRAILASR